jgi:hypothetical protein
MYTRIEMNKPEEAAYMLAPARGRVAKSNPGFSGTVLWAI